MHRYDPKSVPLRVFSHLLSHPNNTSMDNDDMLTGLNDALDALETPAFMDDDESLIAVNYALHRPVNELWDQRRTLHDFDRAICCYVEYYELSPDFARQQVKLVELLHSHSIAFKFLYAGGKFRTHLRSQNGVARGVYDSLRTTIYRHLVIKSIHLNKSNQRQIKSPLLTLTSYLNLYNSSMRYLTPRKFHTLPSLVETSAI